MFDCNFLLEDEGMMAQMKHAINLEYYGSWFNGQTTNKTERKEAISTEFGNNFYARFEIGDEYYNKMVLNITSLFFKHFFFTLSFIFV